MVGIFAAGLVSMVLSLLAGPRFISWLRTRGIGQTIRELGPEHHNVKQGTPTMGGLLIIIAAVIPYLAFSNHTIPSLIVLLLMVGSGAIGLADDLAKLQRRRSLGLNARTKLLLQLLLVLLGGWMALSFGNVDTKLYIPFVDHQVPLGPFYYLLIFAVIAGSSNGVNLTDGLDGLAAGVSAVCLLVYTGIGFLRDEPDIAILSVSVMGACVGFLWYNSFPAEVFMGDTGSLALGGALAGLALVTGTEVILIIVGSVFVVETLSVAIQVISFRFFHRRVFLMAPIHHHFELKNWAETKIIIRFWIVAAISAAVGFTIYFVD